MVENGAGTAFVPVLFVLSIVTGLVGQIGSRASLFIASGVIFGAAVAGAGRQVLMGVSDLGAPTVMTLLIPSPPVRTACERCAGTVGGRQSARTSD
jgi:hypothetical protein